MLEEYIDYIDYTKDTEIEYKITNTFKSYLDFNLVLLYYKELQGFNYKEVYNTFYLLNLIYNGKIKSHILDKNIYSISYQLLYSLTSQNKNHMIYTLLEQELNYSFNKQESNKGYTKGYIIRNQFIDILINPKFLVQVPIEYTKAKFKKYSVINIVGVYFNDKNQLIKELKVSYRKATELSTSFKEEYYGMFCKKPRQIKSDIKDGKVKPQYVHKTEFNTKRFGEMIDYLREQPFNINFPPLQLFYHIFTNTNASKDLFYTRKGGGRLYCMEDKLFTVNPQNMDKRYRNFLFEGQYDYDINTSVISILSQLYYKIFKKSVPESLDKYIKQKEKYRGYLIQKGFTPKQAKSYFSALFFGADVINNLSQINSYSELRRELGKERLENALAIPEVYDLVLDTMEVFEELNKYLKEKTKKEKKGWKLFNTRGSYIYLEKWNKGKAISFIYNGIESQVLDCITSKYEHTCLLFDSFISTKSIDLKELTSYVYENTGYSLTFSKDLIKGDFEELTS